MQRKRFHHPLRTLRGLSHQAPSAISFTPESAFLQKSLACPNVSSSVKHVDGGEDVVG